MTTKFIKGDIHEVIKTLEDNSIDLIYTDPPFAITSAKWDKGLDWKNLFNDMWRVLKEDGVIILYATQRFSYELLKHETPKYHYTWIKNNSTGHFQSKIQPLRKTEEIFIYYKKKSCYNPQMQGDKFYPKRKVKTGGGQGYFNEKLSQKKNEIIKEEGHIGKYPENVLYYPIRDIRTNKSGITRTDDQIDYFIKTYSNENDTILDMTCHNNFVSLRANKLKRNYIGVDIDIK